MTFVIVNVMDEEPTQPTIKSLVVYVPAKQFKVSQDFYRALGFTLTEGWGKTFDCRLGNAIFRLQDYYVKDWAENFMIKLDVEDVEVWHKHIKAILDERSYGDARLTEPEMVGDTKILHVIDPSGVLLIFIQ